MLPVLLLALSPQTPPDIRTTVPLVLAPTTVTDRDGRYVQGLTAEDFQLYDGGRSRPIKLEVFIQPISLVVCIQTSREAGPALAKTRKVGSMIMPLIAGDRGQAAVVTFSDNVRVRQDFTSSEDLLSRAFEKLLPDGDEGRMLDAVDQALRMLSPHPQDRRRVIIVVGESRDRSSEAQLKDVIEEAVRSNVTIYGLHFSAFLTPFTTRGNERFGKEPQKGLEDTRPAVQPQSGPMDIIGTLIRLGKPKASEALAKATGGVDLSFVRLKGLEEVIEKLGDDLHTQYLLSFTPAPATEPGFRDIRVVVRGRDDLTVRTRPGYWTAF